MTEQRSVILDSLLKQALSERASGPDIDLLPGVLAAASATRQRRGWVVGFERSRRKLSIGLIAAALLAAIAGTALIGTGIWRLPSRNEPFHGNGPIVVSTSLMVAVDPTTGAVVDALPLPASSPLSRAAWSPRGDYLAIADEREVLLFDPATRTSRSLVACPACSVSWMPDGTGLALGRSGEIRLVDPSDGYTVGSIDLPGIQVLSVSWEPTGGRIAFTGRAVGGVRLYVVRRDGSDLRVLDGPLENWRFGDVAWSPAGGTIAYLRLDPQTGAGSDASTPNDIQIMRVEPDGAASPTPIVRAGECFCISFAPGFGWSPDGRQLAVTSLRVAVTDPGLYLVDADGSDYHRIIDGATGTPAWRPVP
jgi:Tol biopolymer transport system component